MSKFQQAHPILKQLVQN